LRRIAPYLLLAALAVLFFRQVLFGDYDVPWDLRAFHLPHIHVYADALRQGELPLWDPYTYCGRPFQANIQTEVFYPTVALIAWLGSLFGHRPLLYLNECNVVLHVFLAGAFAYALGRALRLSVPVSLFMATVYELGGFFAAHAEHMGAVSVAAWMPLALVAVVKLAGTPRLRETLLLAAALAMATLAGLTPLTAIVFATTAALAMLLFLVERPRPRFLYCVGCGMGAALPLALVQLAPAIQLTQHSIARFRSDWLGTGGGAPLEALVTLLLPNHYDVFDLAKYRLPYELTSTYLYSGLLGLAFAIIALGRWRARRNLIFALLLVAAGFATLGDSTPIGRWAYSMLPQRIQIGLHPEFTSPAFLLSLAVLAGLGLERTVRSRHLRWAAVALAAADLILMSSGRPMNACPRKTDPAIRRDSFEGYPVTAERARALIRRTNPPGRTDSINNTMNWAMAAPTLQLPSANGYDPLALSRLIEARLAFCKGERWGASYEPGDLRSPMLAAMNVRYIVTRQKLGQAQLGGTALVLREDLPGYSIYENTAALPRFWLVGRVRHASSEEEAARLVRSPGFQPSEEAIVEGGPILPTGSATGAARILRYGLKDLAVETDSPVPTYLASSEVNYPGWKAEIDGQPARLFYTNVAFRGLPVPAGRHVVTMRFAPALLLWAGLGSLAGWLAWGVLWVRSRRVAPLGVE
jgi:hypothetical protein